MKGSGTHYYEAARSGQRRDATKTISFHSRFLSGASRSGSASRRSGDIGRLDREGYLWIEGRRRDLIVSGGENIFPAEVEAVLEAHPAIAEAGVVGRPDSAWGEVPVAVIVAVPGAAAPDPTELARFCAGRLARYKIPKLVETSEMPLPRNAAGKLLRHLLRSGRP